jgi:hypothetical protein
LSLPLLQWLPPFRRIQVGPYTAFVPPLGKTLGREGMVHRLEIAVERYRNTRNGEKS